MKKLFHWMLAAILGITPYLRELDKFVWRIV